MPDPRAELLARVEVRRARVVALERRDAGLALARLVTFAVAGALAIASLGVHRVSARWLFVPVAAFAAGGLPNPLARPRLLDDNHASPPATTTPPHP